MNQQARIAIAENTLQLLEQGYYVNTSGTRINLAPALEFATHHTKLYTPEALQELLDCQHELQNGFTTAYEVTNETTLDAVRRLAGDGANNIMCLNFASAKNAGGGFLGGAIAQEECIARASGLYPCLLKAPEYYTFHRKQWSCLYSDHMIYSPGVPILKDEQGVLLDAPVPATIITAPAVNAGVVVEREKDNQEKIIPVMRVRIAKLLALCADRGHDTLVLGAWGCGVFRNNPEDMAALFHEALTGLFAGRFRQIVFAVKTNKESIIEPFSKYFMTREQVYGALFGVAIGDALGVPAEFKSRTALGLKPIKGFVGYGSHNQPPGTFSDDTSLTFCLASSLCNGYNPYDIGNRFVDWYHKGYWTAGGNVFDIGMTTSAAINRLRQGAKPELAGDFDEDANGNGSLMRILPLLFYIPNMELGLRFQHVKEVSSMTHGHIRSVLACFYYLEFALALLKGADKQEAYAQAGLVLKQAMQEREIIQHEVDLFAPLTDGDIAATPVEHIGSSGYVMDTLKASIHCFITTANYQDAVLKAANLGSDADTTAAVTGGLAGLYYGHAAIPAKWRKEIRRAGDITDLCELLFISL